jgi:hypothetical protein
MMNHLSGLAGHYRKALDSRTEPESIVLIGRTVWSLLLTVLAAFVVVAIGLGIFDLSMTLAVLDQDGKSSEVKLPALSYSSHYQPCLPMSLT